MAAPSKSSDIAKDVIFDGNVLDLDRVYAACALQFLLNSSSFATDSQKSAYLLSHFRGPALDWAARLIDKKPDALNAYASLCTSVRSHFGYDSVQVQAIAQTQLATLRQTGNLLDFLVQFDDTCARAGIGADPSKITLVLPKLTPFYRNAVVCNGDTISTYSTLRSQLVNVHSRASEVSPDNEKQRGKARCKKCGRRGHTGTQCKATN